jgi:segregation and condensation protein B
MGDLFVIDGEENVTSLSPDDMRANLRIVEAMLFASSDPLPEAELARRLTEGVDIGELMKELQQAYAGRGVNLHQVGNAWAFRTASDLSYLMRHEVEDEKKLSRAALETLAIIAYHQPVTRAEIEEIRGVSTSRGTLDVLLETGWIRLRGRRRTPGRPVTFGTTPAFLDQFDLEQISDLPGLAELKGAGLLDAAIPKGFEVPMPSDDEALGEDEDPLDPEDLEDAEASI